MRERETERERERGRGREGEGGRETQKDALRLYHYVYALSKVVCVRAWACL